MLTTFSHVTMKKRYQGNWMVLIYRIIESDFQRKQGKGMPGLV